MAEYDFTSLSFYEFELLARDLVQKEYGITLESFKTGKDQGIDFRYSINHDAKLIVQAKHYVNSGFSTLKSKIKNEELPKVKKLNPDKYILVTSVDFTPSEKDQIFELLYPFCETTGDIYGKSDLNNLLNKYPDIEKQNFKLWLTSYNVLDRIVHSTIYNQSMMDVEKIKRKLKYYVSNSSYDEALNILSENNYCIISGIPGIGKTFLAEVLLIRFLELEYDVIKIVNDITEAISVLNPESKRVYYYDDFLGQSSIQEKLNKNEEQSLLNFLESVKNSESTKFILTTREYILNQAKQTYEKLATSGFDVFKCVVDLEKYTKINRAFILYNHVYFSDLPDDYKFALIRDEGYLRIIEHDNYNPRIIEWMTTLLDPQECTPDDYLELFIQNLDQPARIWSHAFEQQISNESRMLLLTLATLPNITLLEHLEEAFNAFYKHQAKYYGFAINPNAFKESVRELEDTFIRTNRIEDTFIIEFHNPSIRDYLNACLENNEQMVIGLAASAVYFDQITYLWGGVREQNEIKNTRTYLQKDRELVANKVKDTIERLATSVRTMRFGTKLRLSARGVRYLFEDRLTIAIPILTSLELELADIIIGELLEVERSNFQNDVANSFLLPRMIRFFNGTTETNKAALNQIKADAEDYLFNKVNEYESLDEYETLVDFVNEYDEDQRPEERISKVKEEFEGKYLDMVKGVELNDELECEAHRLMLSKISESLSVEVEAGQQIITAREKDIQKDIEEDPSIEAEANIDAVNESVESIAEIKNIFDTLPESMV